MPSGTSDLPGPLSREVAEVINQAIPHRGQARVARDADVSPTQLNRVLNGEKVFKLEELDRVCSVLGLNVTEVIAEADSASRDERAALRQDQNEKLAPVVDGGFGQNANSDDEHIGESWEVADGPVQYDGKKAAKKGTRRADDLPHAE